MEEIQEKLKCACPHECSEFCTYCKTNYEFILDKPISLKCGHCICTNCERIVETKQDLKCIYCKSKGIENTIQKEPITTKTFEEMFNGVLMINFVSNNQKLLEKIAQIEGIII